VQPAVLCDFGFSEVVNLGGGELVRFGWPEVNNNAKAALDELRVIENNIQPEIKEMNSNNFYI